MFILKGVLIWGGCLFEGEIQASTLIESPGPTATTRINMTPPIFVGNYRRKILPKEIRSCLIPCLYLLLTQQAA